MQYGSLFSGIGGFDLGFDRAGMACAWQVEIDAAARSVLSRHWPDVPKFADVREVGASNLCEIDVICAGFPCQDLSVAGNRAGLAGARSGLFFELVRVTHELRPSFLIWENVPGLLNSHNGRDFAAVLMALDHIGYSGAWTTLDAQHFGLAQRRRRVFGVFARRDIGAARCAQILALQDRLHRHPTPSREARQDVAGTLGGSSQSGGFRTTDLDNSGAFVPLTFGVSHQPTPKVGVNLMPTLGNNMTGGVNHVVAHALTGEGFDASEDGTGRGTPLVPIAFDWQAEHGNDTSFKGKSRQYIVRKGDYTGSLQANKRDAVAVPTLAHPLAAGNGHASLADGIPNMAAQAMAVRRLTPVECERLQGFPDDWTAGQADSSRYRQLGNAVAVPCSEWIGRRIVDSC